MKSSDLKQAGSLLADDVLILERGGAERSREEYLGGHAKHEDAFLKEAHIQIKQRTARCKWRHAWGGTESELHGTRQGKPVAVRSTETLVLRRDANGWRLVRSHWSSQPIKSDVNEKS